MVLAEINFILLSMYVLTFSVNMKIRWARARGYFEYLVLWK